MSTAWALHDSIEINRNSMLLLTLLHLQRLVIRRLKMNLRLIRVISSRTVAHENTSENRAEEDYATCIKNKRPRTDSQLLFPVGKRIRVSIGKQLIVEEKPEPEYEHEIDEEPIQADLQADVNSFEILQQSLDCYEDSSPCMSESDSSSCSSEISDWESFFDLTPITNSPPCCGWEDANIPPLDIVQIVNDTLVSLFNQFCVLTISF